MKHEDISINNPDDLNKHLQHSSVVTWVILISVIALLIAFFAWSLIYKLKIKITGTATVTSGEASLHIEETKLDQLKEGQKVYISSKEGLLSFNSSNETVVSSISLDDGTYNCYIVIKEMRPFDFLIK